MTAYPTLAAPGIPAPASFPAPSGVFPASPTASAPTFGVNPYAGQNMYLANVFQQNTLSLLNRSTEQQALMASAQVAAANAGTGADLQSDPRTWTPEQAAQQTDRALAKLSTVNPELANQLASQRTGEPADGGGFFHDLVHFGGQLLHPALSAAGELLSIIGRTAHIVPNLAFDAADGGGFDALGDVAGALTGDVNHNWNAVLQEGGWTGTGVGGFLRATLGLAGDVLTDPITYLLPVGASGHIGEVAAQVAEKGAIAAVTEKVVGKSVEELTGMGLGKFAESLAKMTPEQVAENLTEHWRLLSGQMQDFGARVGISSPDVQERAWSMMNSVFKEGQLGFYRDMWEVGDRAYRIGITRTWRTALKEGMSLSDNLHITARDFKDVLEAQIKSGARPSIGSWDDVAKAAWHESKNMASMLGGTRLKFQIPFTSFRYISGPMFDMARFMPQALGQDAFRFFAGNSGARGILHEIADGNVGWEMLRDYNNYGWRKLAENPAYADSVARLRGRGMNLGSMLHSTSERVGGITEAFDKSWRLSRTGLPGYYSYRDGLQASRNSSAFVRDMMIRTVGEDKDMGPAWEKLGISIDPAKHTATQEELLDVAKALDYFPSGLDMKDPQAIEEWYRRTHPEFDRLEAQGRPVFGQRGENVSPLDEAQQATLAGHQSRLEDMQRVASSFSDEAHQTIEMLRVRWNVARDEAMKYEANIGNVRFRLEEALGIHPTQVEDWKGGFGSHPVTQRTYYIRASDYTAQDFHEMLNRGVTADHIGHESGFSGLIVHSKRAAEDDIEVVIRGADFVEADATGNFKMPGGVVGGDAERTAADVRAETRQAIEEMNAKMGEMKLGEEGAHSAELLDVEEAEMMKKAVIADRPDAAGVYTQAENGDIQATVFDSANVKKVSEQYPVTGEHMGFYHRTLTDAVIEWTRGVVPKDETQILLKEPQLRAEIARRTIGMSLEEANAEARRIILGKFENRSAESLPQWVLELNPLQADVHYVGALSQDITSQILGDAARRMERLGKIAPFMFSAAPRKQEYAWSLSKGFLKALRAMDPALEDAVMRFKKREAAYLDALQRHQGRLATDAGQFNLLMDDLARGDLTLEGVDLNVSRRYHETVTKAEKYLDDWEQTLSDSRKRLEDEQAQVNAARENGRAALVGRTNEELEAVDIAHAAVDARTPEHLPDLDLAGRTKVTEDLKVTQAQMPPDSPAYKRIQEKLDELNGSGMDEKANELAQPDNAVQQRFADDMAQGRLERVPNTRSQVWKHTNESTGVTTYYYVTGDGKTVRGYREINIDGQVGAVTAADFQHRGVGRKLLDAHWDTEGIDTAEKATELINNQVYSRDGAALNHDAIARRFGPSSQEADAIWEQKAEQGDLYLNTHSGSVVNRKGLPVKEHGGTRIRPQDMRDIEHAQVAAEFQDLGKARRAMEEHYYAYQAPEEAQLGATVTITPPTEFPPLNPYREYPVAGAAEGPPPPDIPFDKVDEAVAKHVEGTADVMPIEDLAQLGVVEGHDLLSPEAFADSPFGSAGMSVADAKAMLKKEGWDPAHPAIIEVSPDGQRALSEGYHRLAAARELALSGDKRFTHIPTKPVDARLVAEIRDRLPGDWAAQAREIEQLPRYDPASSAAGIVSSKTVSEEAAAQEAFAKTLEEKTKSPFAAAFDEDAPNAWRENEEMIDYLTDPTLSGRGGALAKADAARAERLASKRKDLLAAMTPEQRILVRAEDVVRRAQNARNAAQEAIDKVDQFSTALAETRAYNKLDRAEAALTKAQDELEKAKTAGQPGGVRTTPRPIEELVTELHRQVEELKTAPEKAPAVAKKLETANVEAAKDIETRKADLLAQRQAAYDERFPQGELEVVGTYRHGYKGKAELKGAELPPEHPGVFAQYEVVDKNGDSVATFESKGAADAYVKDHGPRRPDVGVPPEPIDIEPARGALTKTLDEPNLAYTPSPERPAQRAAKQTAEAEKAVAKYQKRVDALEAAQENAPMHRGVRVVEGEDAVRLSRARADLLKAQEEANLALDREYAIGENERERLASFRDRPPGNTPIMGVQAGGPMPGEIIPSRTLEKQAKPDFNYEARREANMQKMLLRRNKALGLRDKANKEIERLAPNGEISDPVAFDKALDERAKAEQKIRNEDQWIAIAEQNNPGRAPMLTPSDYRSLNTEVGLTAKEVARMDPERIHVNRIPMTPDPMPKGVARELNQARELAEKTSNGQDYWQGEVDRMKKAHEKNPSAENAAKVGRAETKLGVATRKAEEAQARLDAAHQEWEALNYSRTPASRFEVVKATEGEYKGQWVVQNIDPPHTVARAMPTENLAHGWLVEQDRRYRVNHGLPPEESTLPTLARAAELKKSQGVALTPEEENLIAAQSKMTAAEAKLVPEEKRAFPQANLYARNQLDHYVEQLGGAPRYEMSYEPFDYLAERKMLEERQAAGEDLFPPYEEQRRRPGEQRTPQERAQYATQRTKESMMAYEKRERAMRRKALEAGKVIGRHKARLNEAFTELNRTYAEAKGVRALFQPALVEVPLGGEAAGLTRMRIPGLEGFMMPSYIAEEWHSILDTHGPGHLTAEWRKWVLGPWKRWATYRWPGFHVRNAYGAWFNNYLGGVGIDEYTLSWRVNNFGKKAWEDVPVDAATFKRYNLGMLMGKDSEGELTYGQLRDHLSTIGIGRANTRSVMEAANSVAYAKEGVSLLDRNVTKGHEVLQRLDGHMRDVGGGVESYHRVAAWWKGMEHTNGDTMGAREFVMMRHGDYAELTSAEDHIRDIIPFYKWMRTNIPYQIRMLGENPAKMTFISQKLKSYAYDVAGVDQTAAEVNQPEFMKQTFTVPIPDWVPFVGSKGPDGLKYLMADLPYNDLYNGLNDYWSAALPVVRNIFESYGLHESVFTGAPLKGRMVQLSGIWNAPGIRDALSAMPFIQKGPDGNIYIPDTFENVLTAWPIYSRFRNFMEADPNRVQQRLSGLFSMIAGVSLRPADATQAELDFYYNEVDPLLQQYRDMGVNFPDAGQFAKAGATLNPTTVAAYAPPADGVLFKPGGAYSGVAA
jgi:hypothetical protein